MTIVSEAITIGEKGYLVRNRKTPTGEGPEAVKSDLRLGTCYFILILFMLSMGAGTHASISLPEFPIGLTLGYDKETDYHWGSTHIWTDAYEVAGWNAPDNSSVTINNVYSRSSYTTTKTLQVSLPSWDCSYYDHEINETVFEWMYPLWADVSNWNIGENITLNAESAQSRVYQIQGQESVEIDEGSIRCWVLRTEFTDASGWHYSRIIRYDFNYGILIKLMS
ncbi:MAG: hypothetical protein ACFFAY_14785, partial [Promethearchaeota archaeon]